MSELAITFRTTGDATSRMAVLQMPNSMREHVVPRLHALAQHHLSASAMALFIASLIGTHLPNLRATRQQMDTLVPALIDALVVPEDVSKVVALYALTEVDRPPPRVRPLEDGWPGDEPAQGIWSGG